MEIFFEVFYILHHIWIMHFYSEDINQCFLQTPKWRIQNFLDRLCDFDWGGMLFYNGVVSL